MELFEKIKQILENSLETGEEVVPTVAPDTKAPAQKAATAKPSTRMDGELQGLLENGKPSGKPLASTLRQSFLANRTREYKSTTDANYRDSTRKVKALFESLNRGDPVTLAEIKATVHDFLTLLKTDRNILLNLSYLPSEPADYLYTHSVNTSLLSMALAAGAGYSEDQVRDIAMAALLIDVGMMRVPESIRSKTGSLTEDEIFEIRKHPITGADMMQSIIGLTNSSILAIYQHHERMSGSGYPKQRAGHLIHEYSRIIAITDTYAAMVANRNYRKRQLPYNAMTAIIKMGSTGILDSVMIRRFLETMSLFPLGSLVRLSSGAIGKIIHTNLANFTKPTLFILQAGKDNLYRPNSILDLNTHPDVTIVEALDDVEFPHDPMTGF